MAKITILPVDLAAEVKPGDSLLDAGEAAGVEMEAGCFNCSCGACVVQIVSGGNQLVPPTTEELAVLAQSSRDPEHFRLACCTRVEAGATGEVMIRQLE